MTKLDRLKLQREQLREMQAWWATLANDTVLPLPYAEKQNLASALQHLADTVTLLGNVIGNAESELRYWNEPPSLVAERDILREEVVRRERRSIGPDAG